MGPAMPSSSKLIDQFVRIPVAGGRTLAARLWRPEGSAPVPAILDFSPYRAFDIFRPLVEPSLPWWAAQGYAVLAVDIAGSGGSTGLLLDEYRLTEIEDAATAVEWVAAQSWCDGAVGLSGLSWAAFTALRVSDRAPKALKAMVLGGVSEDGWTTDIQNLGGAPYAAKVDWAGVMLMFNSLPPDPKQFGDGWRDEWLKRLAANRPWIETWLSHPERDAYWQGKTAAAQGSVPLLLYSGWADKYATSVLRIAARWRGPVRTIIGPWEHATPTTAARGPRIGFLQEALRWWDKWLKGRETGVMEDPPLRLWVATPNRQGDLAEGKWRGMAWPMLPGPSQIIRFGTGTLVLSPKPRTQVSLGADLYEDAPGPWPISDALLGAPVAEDMEIVAAPVLRCRLTSDKPGGLLVARLLDIAPDGQAVRMTTGALNLAFQDGAGHAAPLKAGETFDITLPFQATAWQLKAGHRIGLQLSADGWPTLWPGRAGATLTLDRASLALNLPLAGALTAVRAFESPVAARAADIGAAKWLDAATAPLLPTGLTDAAAYAPPPGLYHLAATGADYLMQSRFELALADGGREGVAAKVYRVAIERPDWSIRVATRLVVRSTPRSFAIDWTVRAEDSGKLFFDHSGSASVARSVV